MRFYYEDNPKAALVEVENMIEEALIVARSLMNFERMGLVELPDSLAQLTQLQSLHAYGNRFTGVPPVIRKLRILEVLSLGANRLNNVPDFIGELRELTHLFLDDNQLTSLPPVLGQLTKLKVLDLSNNNLEFLPKTLTELKSLERILLHGNSALGLPPEVLGPGSDAIENGQVPAKPAEVLDYYFRTKGGARPLNEAKLILIGRGEVGKTALVNRLVHNKFKRTEMTRGIAITQWPVSIESDTVRLNVWDFGGQEIQHATHQFFLTERSLYLVVLNGRAGAEDEDAEYWLKFIKTFGGSSPAIVVLNKFKVQPFELNRRGLQEKYPFVRAFVETDCKPNARNGRAELIVQIKSALAAMEYVRADFPADWFRIKERLAQMQELGESFISFEEYRKICVDLGENDPQAQERLAGFLNALGIALNFREDEQLREETVLNPHWITSGVYQIITSPRIASQKGELRLGDLAEIFKGKHQYPIRMHGFLIELMRKFELCFSYHDDPREHRYLVPELLGKEKPNLKEPFLPPECQNYRYDYRLMPEGLLPRFITRTHTMSDPSERWRTGVVLRWEDGRALVEADKQERQVFVRVIGKRDKRRRMLAVIRENLDRIHVDMKEFKPTEWTALEGHPDGWVDCEELAVFEQQNQVFSKRIGNEVVPVDVSKVLDETDVPGARDKGDARSGRKRKLRLFISYAHLDEKWRVKLKPNLELLQREGLIEIWSDHEIVAGTKWDDEIKAKLESADLYLFLMTTHLLNSDYIRENELPTALKRYKEKKAGFVPVVVQRCSWQKYIGEIQGLPSDGRPISDWRPYDRACFDVEEGLRKTIEEVRHLIGK